MSVTSDSYIGMIFGLLNLFMNFTNMVTDTANCAQPMFEITDAVPEITDVGNPIVIEKLAGDKEGSGKSTIANLISRLYDTVSGTISIDEHNVKEIASKTLRDNISIVFQEIFFLRVPSPTTSVMRSPRRP